MLRRGSAKFDNESRLQRESERDARQEHADARRVCCTHHLPQFSTVECQHFRGVWQCVAMQGRSRIVDMAVRSKNP